MWTNAARKDFLAQLEHSREPWDILIIGGGITGAGIFAEASRHRLKVLLVEEKDFAWGSSSRSSKMIHGGLRYLYQGEVLLTWHAARERQFLLQKYPGLIEPLSFILPIYQGRNPPKWLAMLGIGIYDLLAGHWNHGFWNPDKVLAEVPGLSQQHLKGAVHFTEATTDDVRLVLRLLQEGTKGNAYPLNYIHAAELIKDRKGICGAILKDSSTGKQYEVKSKLVINATGAWADRFRAQLSQPPRMRPLRGSHLLFSAERFPLQHTVSFLHPEDGRPVFACPWYGAAMVGTTDLDHRSSLNLEPSITKEEAVYLLDGVAQFFPTMKISSKDILSSFAGIRPVVGSGKAKPSQESRDTVMWWEQGLLTVTGGKLTTFRYVARQVLSEAKRALPQLKMLQPEKIAKAPPLASDLPNADILRLCGHYGPEAPLMISTLSDEDRRLVGNAPILWGELRWAARYESVVHLDDLLLRRTRVGLLLPKGGEEILDRVGQICQEELHWTPEQWEEERQRYLANWRSHYNLPEV